MPNSICDVFVELIMRAVPCIDRFYGDSLPEFAKKSCSGLCVIQRIEKSLRNERSPLPHAFRRCDNTRILFAMASGTSKFSTEQFVGRAWRRQLGSRNHYIDSPRIKRVSQDVAGQYFVYSVRVCRIEILANRLNPWSKVSEQSRSADASNFPRWWSERKEILEVEKEMFVE